MFAHTRAATVAPASTEALPVSVRRKSRSAVRLCQTVRPENSDPLPGDSLIVDHDLPLAGSNDPRSQTRQREAAADGPDVPERGRDARGAGALHDRGGSADRGAPHGAALPLLLGPR